VHYLVKTGGSVCVLTHRLCHFSGYRSNPTKGRFSHVAVPAFGNTLLVVGGYRGNVLGDLLAFMVPQVVARNQVNVIHLCAFVVSFILILTIL